MNTFLLTPRRIPVERKASAAKREVEQDMVAREESVSEVGSDAESGQGCQTTPPRTRSVLI